MHTCCLHHAFFLLKNNSSFVQVPMSKVNWDARMDSEYISNYKVPGGVRTLGVKGCVSVVFAGLRREEERMKERSQCHGCVVRHGSRSPKLHCSILEAVVRPNKTMLLFVYVLGNCVRGARTKVLVLCGETLVLSIASYHLISKLLTVPGPRHNQCDVPSNMQRRVCSERNTC